MTDRAAGLLIVLVFALAALILYAKVLAWLLGLVADALT